MDSGDAFPIMCTNRKAQKTSRYCAAPAAHTVRLRTSLPM